MPLLLKNSQLPLQILRGRLVDHCGEIRHIFQNVSVIVLPIDHEEKLVQGIPPCENIPGFLIQEITAIPQHRAARDVTVKGIRTGQERMNGKQGAVRLPH